MLRREIGQEKVPTGVVDTPIAEGRTDPDAVNIPRAQSSHPAWDYVAVNLTVCADENNPVPGGISRVPF